VLIAFSAGGVSGHCNEQSSQKKNLQTYKDNNMSVKKNNRYKILLQEIELKDGTQTGKSIELEFENHDNIFSLIEMTKDSDRFENKTHNTQFILGLKLFSEVMIRNRNNPLFEDFAPSFKEFMKKLKEK